jgi:hypothetical protein
MGKIHLSPQCRTSDIIGKSFGFYQLARRKELQGEYMWAVRYHRENLVTYLQQWLKWCQLNMDLGGG